MIAPASRKLGKYEIRQKLGRGGMADVYLAQDTEAGAVVALKLIEHSAATDTDTHDAIEAERRGAELQAHLAAIDPRVVRVYGAGDMEGYFYVAMEYVDGQDLAELMRHGPLAPAFAADVALAVAETLEKAHTLQVAIEGKNFQGIVHGDIKPKNIRIDARGEVRVLDFGIAKALTLSRRLTRNEFGSVPYASPERLDTGDVNALSDLWSLAVMLYEMATGLRPYQADSTERLERMIRSRIPPSPAPDPCPEPLRRILMKAMAPEPALRYQSAKELAQDLTAFRKGDAVAAEAEDMDATRRTHRLPAGDDDTRRTSSNSVTGYETPKSTKPAASPRVRGKHFYTMMRVLASLVVAVVVYAAWAMVSDYRLYENGRDLQHAIEAEQVTGLNDIWSKWTELSGDNPSSFYLRGPRAAVRQKLVAAADHVIDTYRNTDTVVYETDWKNARTYLMHALELDPDNAVRGKLRLCEGHLARINGTSHRSPAELNLAVEDFTEAEKLMANSPDPELGLARVYVSGLKDVDKASEAFQQAEKRGYHLGNREKMQLADVYLDRADRLWWDSRNVRGLPQEKDQIQRAVEDYKKALALYQEIAPYSKANSQIVRIQNSLESVSFRLQQIESGNAAAPLRDAIQKVLRTLPIWR
ncbi:MAG: serine/threonine protein kinase [Acidobacteriia bacterium]|nr:serine/threonine protein kinase [Terriglobia bacterium]